jgi:predicted nucleotidyltransferase
MLKPINPTLKPNVNALLKQVEIELIKFLGDKLKKLMLFGSYSRGDSDFESDIDIFALVDESNPEEKFKEQILDIMVNLSLEFDLVLSIFMENVKEYEEEKNVIPLFKNIEKEGIEIYAA